jgi:FkbH-like protein
MAFTDLYWLAERPDWDHEVRRIGREGLTSWQELVFLANFRLDFTRTIKLDKLALSRSGPDPSAADRPAPHRIAPHRIASGRIAPDRPADMPAKPIRLAVLGSSTADHLLPGLRVAALRRGMLLQTYLGDYGQYRQELLDEDSPLHRFKPDVVLFAFDAHHLAGDASPALGTEAAEARVEAALADIRNLWRRARAGIGAQVLQQAVLPVFPNLLGSNEHRLAGSPAQIVTRLNQRLREIADAEGVDIVAVDEQAGRDGLAAWHNPVLWHRAKQEISPAAAPAYGELALRIVAARQGRSFKCLVLDLDNTVWGGVIGDDGLDGIRLGQGSAEGEAFVAFQRYARDLARRGIILAVCSKNDEQNALAPFEQHPDMVLKRSDIACFIANWNDKASGLRDIAERLNIGIDSLVFVDDNPFERNIIRRELPMVAVPEIPEDPAFYAQCVADGGYFEAIRITPDDLERSGQYQANAARESLRQTHTDLAGYLQSLDMSLRWAPFDPVGLQRVVQLINKTNQFNLTTRRYSEQQVADVMADRRALTLQLRLVDRFGDNGIIGIIIGKPEGETLLIDTWLMSCRVLGRQVEEATMNLIVAEASRLGMSRIVGEYVPTGKNGMVREHYRKLGFTCCSEADNGASLWRLAVPEYTPFSTFVALARS